ncbi:hypothetical protein QBC39DRAFT_334431 [Podospora conica]|nr:hypothetical protein QBC39DRAFT_334431 [Schizothecium conicum]
MARCGQVWHVLFLIFFGRHHSRHQPPLDSGGEGDSIIAIAIAISFLFSPALSLLDTFHGLEHLVRPALPPDSRRDATSVLDTPAPSTSTSTRLYGMPLHMSGSPHENQHIRGPRVSMTDSIARFQQPPTTTPCTPAPTTYCRRGPWTVVAQHPRQSCQLFSPPPRAKNANTSSVLPRPAPLWEDSRLCLDGSRLARVHYLFSQARDPWTVRLSARTDSVLEVLSPLGTAIVVDAVVASGPAKPHPEPTAAVPDHIKNQRRVPVCDSAKRAQRQNGYRRIHGIHPLGARLFGSSTRGSNPQQTPRLPDNPLDAGFYFDVDDSCDWLCATSGSRPPRPPASTILERQQRKKEKGKGKKKATDEGLCGPMVIY